jgi:type II secretory pathway component PulC
LERSEVLSSLDNLDSLLAEIRINPFTKDQSPAGFQLAGVMGWNILAQMGLRSGDVITAVNEQPIHGPQDARGFFQTLAEGGEITVEVLRRHLPLQVHLSIQ